jgi:carbon-monoxide dehydrogenase iron sulfur subunit
MSGALQKNTKTGLVEYDEKKCAACYMCVMNCPYGVLKPDSKTRTRIIKCDFCKEKADGPNCVQACPKQAIEVREVTK